MTKTPKETIDRIIRLRKNNFEIATIAKLTGVSVPTVSRILKKYGLTKKGGSNKKLHTNLG